jgi:hypothetical protein
VLTFFKSSIAKILIIMFVLKVMLIMVFNIFIFKIHIHMYYSRYSSATSVIRMSFIKNSVTYSISQNGSPFFFLSLLHTPLFYQWNQILNQVHTQQFYKKQINTTTLTLMCCVYCYSFRPWLAIIRQYFHKYIKH